MGMTRPTKDELTNYFFTNRNYFDELAKYYYENDKEYYSNNIKPFYNQIPIHSVKKKDKKPLIIALIALFIVVVLPLMCLISVSFNKSGSKKTDDVVFNHPWDASVYQVEQYLKENLRDPGSYEGIEWSKVVKNDDGTFHVRHKYRAKNGFGGYMVEEKVFKLSSNGKVISALNYN